MAEAFGRDHGLPSAQLGLRWTPRERPIDGDLLVARRIDGLTPTTVTLGVTLRR